MNTTRLWFYKLIVRLLPETRFFAFKVRLLRWSGIKVGKNVRVNSSAIFLGNGEIEIGDDVWIGAQDFIMATAPAKITIGSQCDFGPQVSIITGTHDINLADGHIAGEGKSESVFIRKGCWLGAKSLILPGVELRERTLVAAGSVVTQSNKESNCLLAGVPASFKKRYL